MFLETFTFLLSYPYFLNTNDVLGTAAEEKSNCVANYSRSKI